MKTKTKTKGFSVIEIIVALAIILTVVIFISNLMNLYFKFTQRVGYKTQAAVLAEEASEAILIIRDMGWIENIDSLSEGANYYIDFEDGEYFATSTPIVIDGTLSRTIVIEPVYRDENDSIVESGTEDTNTKKATITISRVSDGYVFSESKLLIHNIHNN
ncbi:MAG: hypothetical protein COV70_02415 [Parcubacteria group bacterium CG11_big_fil_rev_8_21_14_0_20_39_22]|nr:MAG: hypothetical protein COV70_02415 [Parcubacteria group bacterium CG11_big_fil_rev_8_21_14_0_20_39_22]